MTDVAFHFNVTDKTAYAVRLLRKIHHASARAVLVGDEASVAAVDRLLWAAPPEDFVAHLRCADGQPDADAVRLNPLLMFDLKQTLSRELVGSHGVPSGLVTPGTCPCGCCARGSGWVAGLCGPSIRTPVGLPAASRA